MSCFTDEDVCIAAVKINGILVYLCSLYLDILESVQNKKFLEAVRWCEREKIPFVVGMDSNAHSPPWGSSDKNPRGEELEDIFLVENLMVMNVGSVPTFQTSRAESVIDVTAINSWAQRWLTLEKWQVSKDPSFSDHNYISFQFGSYEAPSEMFQNLKRANWGLFRDKLSEAEGSLMPLRQDGKNINECAETFQRLIREALDVACPWKKALKQKPNPWWNTNLDNIRRELKTLSMKRRRSE